MSDTNMETVRGYELRNLIGQGGFGAVYRAYQPIVNREVAIKIILPEYANDPSFVRSFEAEAQTIASLEHLNIIPMYDFWREPGKAFLVMRWLRGGSLQQRLKENTPLLQEDIIRLLDQIASALAQAHRHGIVHRDLKPANILLDEEQNAYLSDFGLAIKVKPGSGTSTEVVGTPRYMAPEQITGDLITPQTDLYAFAIMFYEIITGNHPFSGNMSEMLLGHLHNAIPPIQEFKPDLPSELNAVFKKAAEKNPDARYRDAREFAIAFKQAFVALGSSKQADEKSNFGATTTHTGMVNPLMYSFDIELAVQNPYKGLRAFEENDAADFFGREALVERLLNQLRQTQFMAVIGPSGSGKSSVVKAGVLPKIRQGALAGSADWYIVELVPGSSPLEKLHSALLGIATRTLNLDMRLRESPEALQEAVANILPDDGSELLLVIDQFEEIFTQVNDEKERAQFLESLRLATTNPASRIRVIVTLRADFYDRPLLYPQFGELVRQNTEVVLPLSPEEIERTIVGPADRVGLEVEPALIAAIVSDVSEEPGALPLLQYALTELFEKRDGNTLTLEAYRSSGGVLGALARRAETLFLSLDNAQQEAARQLFLRLVTPGEGSDDTRRRMLWGEMTAIDTEQQVMQSVIDSYGKYRLLTFDNDPQTREPTIEVAHEAIIRQWKRLRDWLDASREDLRMQRMLGGAAHDWTQSDQDPSFLLRGTRLTQFEEWMADAKLALTQDERQYVDASLKERRRQETEAAERAAYQSKLERRSRQFLQWLVAAMAIGLVIAGVLSAIAVDARVQAEKNEENAKVSAIRSESLRYSAEANTLLQSKSNNELAALLGIYALDLNYSPEADAVLSEVAGLDFPLYYITDHEDEVYSVQVSHDNRYLLSSSLDGSIRLWDVQTGEPVRTIQENLEFATYIAEFSPDDSQILTISDNGDVQIWDTETGEEVHLWAGDDDAFFTTVTFAPDGKTFAAGENNGMITIFDAATTESLQTFDLEAEVWIESLAFTSDGKTLVSGDDEGYIVVWDVESGDLILEIDELDNQIFTVKISPDDSLILTASFDGTSRLWDIETGNEVRRFVGHIGPVWAATFSPDGQTILTGGEDQTARVWDVDTGKETRRLTGHPNTVRAVAFSPDNQIMFTGGLGSLIKAWAVTPDLPTYVYTGHEDLVFGMAISADGKTLYSGSLDTTARAWDIETGEETQLFEGHEDSINGLALSPNGFWLATSSRDGTIGIWDVKTGEEVQTIGADSDLFMATIAFSPDNLTVVTGNNDNAAHLWNIQTGEEVRKFEGHTEEIWGVAFSPDGSQIATTSYDKTARVWNVQTGEQVAVLEGHTAPVWSAAFSPDGKTLVTSADDTVIILWDIASGKEIRRFEGHTAAVFSVIFSADGKYLLSGSGDTTARVWDVETGKEIRRLAGHQGAVNVAQFSPDSVYIFTGSNDTTLRRWYANVDSLVNLVCSRLIRDFTDEERRRYAITSDTATCPAP